MSLTFSLMSLYTNGWRATLVSSRPVAIGNEWGPPVLAPLLADRDETGSVSSCRVAITINVWQGDNYQLNGVMLRAYLSTKQVGVRRGSPATEHLHSALPR